MLAFMLSGHNSVRMTGQLSAQINNPADWHGVRTTRAPGDGQYLVGRWNTPASPSMWGLRVLTTPSISEGAVLVMDTSQLAILDRSQVGVMISNEGASNLTATLVTILAECRCGLAVFSPSAVAVVGAGSP